MEIYLLQPPFGGGPDDVAPPVGLLAMAATLELEKHEPHVVDLNLQLKTGKLDLAKNLKTQLGGCLPKRSSRIGLVGISTWSYNFDVTVELILAIKAKHPHVPIVLGGPHVTFVDQEALRAFPEVAFCLRDEGDWTFPKLVRAVENGGKPEELAAIPGLTWRKGTEIVRNPSGPVVEDLDGLPYPAYHRIDPREYVACSPVLVLEAGRGCPYNCNFCSTTNMFQRKYRVKSPKRIVDEALALMKVTGTKRFELLHDNLVANKAYVRALCQEIRSREVDLDWSCTSRTDNLTEDLCHEMFLAGCVSIFFGIESMSEERQKWTGKRLKPPLVEEAVALTARQHVTPNMGIIVGFPEETDEELDATLEAAVRWTADPQIHGTVSTAALRFYPGADLFGQAALLRYDEVVEADNSSIPGYKLRPEWRSLTRLFSLSCSHAQPDETRRVLAIRNFVRVLLKACPQTLRACFDILGLRPSELIRRMLASRSLDFLDRPTPEKTWNESVRALGSVVEASGNEVVQELLSCEVPFWRTQPITGPLDRLEHVIHPKRFEHGALLAFVSKKAKELPPRIEGTSILSIRGGRECVVWFTKEPENTLAAFEKAYAQDRKGTLQFLQNLKRGL